MKFNHIIVIIYLVIIIGCDKNKTQVNHFTESCDTLVLQTEKIKGVGLFSPSAGQIMFGDTSENHLFPVIFPDDFTNVKIYYQFVDFELAQLERRRKNASDYIEAFLKAFHIKLDSLNIPSLEDNYIPIMAGKLGEDSIFIVDENNNKDFRDDSVRFFQKMDWFSTDLIKCKYNVFDGEKMRTDSTWINIGVLNEMVLFFVSNHLESTFFIENQKYTIGVFDKQYKFCFDDPMISLISENGINKDSLPEGDLLKKDEYLKLGNRYYRFADISNAGKHIILIKENDVSNKTGTQVGFIAPDFKCVSMNGDSIELKNFQNKLLLIANVTSCFSEPSSYQHYKDLTDAYADKMEILCLDKAPIILKNNVEELSLSGKFIDVNKNEQLTVYRPAFCYRTCYLISFDRHIIDKFEISDWEQALSKHIVNR